METIDINITRVLNAPVQKVWDAWTNPEHVAKWWGPKDFTGRVGKIELKKGGKYVYCMRGPAGSPFDQDMWSAGEYEEVIPLKKIVATDYFSDKDGNWVSPKDFGMPGEWPEKMRVTVTFEEAGPGKTKLTLKHEGHPAEMANDATTGWNQSLDKFEAVLR